VRLSAVDKVAIRAHAPGLSIGLPRFGTCLFPVEWRFVLFRCSREQQDPRQWEVMQVNGRLVVLWRPPTRC
jgi:hypothetical protein